MVLHDLIMGNGQIKGVQLIIIFNKRPDILKKTSGNDESQKLDIFNREDIRKINNAWTECPFNNEQLKKFFDVEKLNKYCKTASHLIDVNERKACVDIFSSMAEEINIVQKAAKKAAEQAEKQKAAELAKKAKQGKK